MSKGGMGMRAAEDHATVANAASLFASQPLAEALQGIQEEEEKMNHTLGLPDHLMAALSATMGEEAAEADLVGVPLYQLEAKVDVRQRKLLEEGVEEEEVEVRARLQSLTIPHVGDWLHAAPILALGLQIRVSLFFQY